jgi:hypothetical protein
LSQLAAFVRLRSVLGFVAVADGVVLVLSEAVLVIVIDARAVGWTGLARAGELTEAQRHGGLTGGGFSQRHKVAKGWRAGGGHGMTRTITEEGWMGSYSYGSEVVLVLSAAVLGSV